MLKVLLELFFFFRCLWIQPSLTPHWAMHFFFLMLRKNRHVGVYKREKNTAELEHVVMMLRHKKAWPQNEALKICANPYLYTQRPTVIVMIIMHLIAVWNKCLHTRIQEWKRKGYEWIQHRGKNWMSCEYRQQDWVKMKVMYRWGVEGIVIYDTTSTKLSTLSLLP